MLPSPYRLATKRDWISRWIPLKNYNKLEMREVWPLKLISLFLSHYISPNLTSMIFPSSMICISTTCDLSMIPLAFCNISYVDRERKMHILHYTICCSWLLSFHTLTESEKSKAENEVKRCEKIYHITRNKIEKEAWLWAMKWSNNFQSFSYFSLSNLNLSHTWYPPINIMYYIWKFQRGGGGEKGEQIFKTVEISTINIILVGFFDQTLL